MSDVTEGKVNPANTTLDFPKDFKPMSSSTLRLEVPERDGYHRHWFRGTPERLNRAWQAGYRFVNEEEVRINNFDVGGDMKQSGNTDLGTRVSVISGDDVDATGQPGRLYLMECPNEYFEASMNIIADRNEQIATALRGGLIGAGGEDGEETGRDQSQRYVKGTVPDLFNPHKRRF